MDTLIHPRIKLVELNNPTLPLVDKLSLKPELPPGWDLERVQRILACYEPQRETEHKNFNDQEISLLDLIRASSIIPSY